VIVLSRMTCASLVDQAAPVSTGVVRSRRATF
jgi:hypothetical protein